jgi:uncharacterized protein
VKTPPSRTCVGCRRARPQAALVRLVRLASGTVVVDGRTRAAGRGAYVCPDAECLGRGLSRGRLGHAFRKPSEAGPNLAAAVRAAAPREVRAPLADAGREDALLCDVSAGAIEDVDVITVRS